MDASGWIGVLRQLPPELHDGFSFIMSNGLEIIVQAFMRLDEQHVMIRGRVSGSTDSGRILFLPYDQINVLVYNKLLKDPDVYAWFADVPVAADVQQVGGETAPGPAAAEGEPGAPEAEPEQQPAAAGPPQKPAAQPAPPPPKPAAPQPMPMMGGMSMPAKAAMIERLRKRAQGGGNPPEHK